VFDAGAFLYGGAVMFGLALAGWVASLVRGRVDMVDALWALLFLAAAVTYALSAAELDGRALLVLALVALWALRLSGYILLRNHGKPEDRRYRAIRERNQPRFAIKSVYLVFGLQAALAWVISLPLLAAIASTAPWGWLDVAGVAVWAVGFGFESIADRQLARFKRMPQSAGQVMDSGLWRYSRHPNYFGECSVWWGFYLIALGAGGWWALLSPLLVTFLLLRVSGVALLEKDIGGRRPEYAAYRARTPAFFPRPPRAGKRA
jgi:steroid 5-alpha reductase family enzyme